MTYFDILTDASCDLTPEQAGELGVVVLPMGVSVGTDDFLHYPDYRELKAADFYAALRAGMGVSTGSVGLAFWLDSMEESLRLGRDVLVVSIASTMSGSIQNARIAADELRGEYPEREIIVVDSLSGSLGMGLLLKMASIWRGEGMSAAETAAHVEAAKTHIVHIFTADDLDHLRRGGRISAAAAVIGSVLGVKPIIGVDREGRLSSIGKARGRKNAIRSLAGYAQSLSGGEGGREFCITHADCPGDADSLASEIRARCGDVPTTINLMCPVLAAHCGPGGLALFFVGRRTRHIVP